MVLIRRCEEQLARSHQRGLIHGACHTYVGQEAIAAGVCASAGRRRRLQHAPRPRPCPGQGGRASPVVRRAVRPRDRLLAGARRQHAPVRPGSRHDGHQRHRRPVHPPGGRGRLQLQAARRPISVAVAFFGDGAVNNGAFHEGLNMAGIWKLPVLFVCENNQFATEVPFAYAAGNPSVASRGASYGMPGVELDGNDVLAVYEAAGEAVAPRASGEARRCSSAGPTAPGRTPRAWATSPTAPARRSKPGRPAARSRGFAPRSSKQRPPTIDELDAIDAEIDAVVDDAHQFAESSPWPDPATAAIRVQ